MSEPAGPYVHATALVVGERGILIRGPSGAGKSRLAALLISEGHRRGWFARLVGDDRVALVPRHGRILARGHPAVAGMIERRGEGIGAVAFEAACVIGYVVDLVAERPDRLPDVGQGRVRVLGQALPRLLLEAGLRDVESGEVLDRLLTIPPG